MSYVRNDRGTGNAVAMVLLLVGGVGGGCGGAPSSPLLSFGEGGIPDSAPSSAPTAPRGGSNAPASQGSGSGISANGRDGGGSSVLIPGGDCPESAKLVYVTGEGSKLYSFYPPTFTFTLIGSLDCLADYSPTHMTVDRTGTAWIAAWPSSTDTGSSLFTASTTNAACSRVANWRAQSQGYFTDFALTFVGLKSPDTTLYLLGDDGTQAALGAFDTESGTLVTVGPVNASAPAAGGDMTTNGDGTLYFLQDASPLSLYEIAPSNASVLNDWTPGATGGGDQALAFYGGSFYLFEDNVVYAFDTATQATKRLGEAPLSVTGAGESTCVPRVAPPLP